MNEIYIDELIKFEVRHVQFEIRCVSILIEIWKKEKYMFGWIFFFSFFIVFIQDYDDFKTKRLNLDNFFFWNLELKVLVYTYTHSNEKKNKFFFFSKKKKK